MLLPYGVVLAVELNGLVETRSIERGLHVPGDREPVLESDERALIDPEEIACLFAERTIPQVARETVRQSEIAPVERQSQRCRQVDDNKIRFCTVDRGLVVLLHGGRGGRKRRHVWC